MRSMPHKFADAVMSPEEHVQAANEMAYKFAADAPLRGLAMRIIGPTKDVFRDGPVRIAQWIVENVQYGQESPGIEILQGPYTTLPAGLEIGDFRFGGIGVGDCDDLALLFATLCRGAGLNGFFAGVCEGPFQGSFIHAMGYCADNQCFYELSKDESYGGVPNKPLEMKGIPVGQEAFIWDPALMQWQKFRNDPLNPAQTYSVDDGGPMYDKSRMAGSRIHVGPPNSMAMSRPRAMGTTGRGETIAGALQYLTGGAGIDARAAAGDDTTSSQGFFEDIATTGEAIYQFGQDVGYGGSTANGGDQVFAEGIIGGRNFNDVRNDLEAKGITGLGAAPTLTMAGLENGASVYAAASGNNDALKIAKSGLSYYSATAAGVTAGIEVGVSLGLITAAAATSAIPVVNVVVAGVVALACCIAGPVRNMRRHNKAEDQSDAMDREVLEFCAELCGDPRRSVDSALQTLWLYQRIYEFVTITSGNYGANHRRWRCAVRTVQYDSHLKKVLTQETPGGPRIMSLLKMAEWGHQSREAQEMGFARDSFGFMDGCRYSWGIDHACKHQGEPTLRIVQEGREQVQALIRMVTEITHACIYGGHCSASADRLREFKLGLTLAVMAQVITLRISTVKQRDRLHANGDMGGLDQYQREVGIDVFRFWNGFYDTFGTDRESAVRPVETYFGAPFGTFDDGLIRHYLGEETPFPIFDTEDQQSPDWSESTPGGSGGYGGPTGGGGGTGLALAAVGVGALILSNK